MSVVALDEARLFALGLGALVPSTLGASFPELRLLVLFGSRARGDNHMGSDWDFGYLADPGLDIEGLEAHLAKLVNSDELDVVALERASGVLRHQAADQGVALFEREPETFTNYILEVLRFWLHVAPIIRQSQEEQLRSLG